MRKLAIKTLFLIDRFLHFLKVPRGTFLWKVNGVLLRKLKRNFVKIHGFEMFLDRRDSLGLSLSEFEPDTVQVFKKYIKPGDIVLDIGANIGYFSLLACKLGANVLAFEPEPESYKLLEQNVRYNHYDLRTKIFNKAVSDSFGKVKLYLNPDNLAGHSLFDYGNQRGGGLEVDKISLDNFLPSTKADFIKIDIEGAEYRAFMGMKKIIASNPHVKIVMEYYTSSPAPGLERHKKELIDFLNGSGFKFYEILIHGLRPRSAEELKSGNYEINLFCKR